MIVSPTNPIRLESDKIRFSAQGPDDIPSTSLTHDSGMLQRPKSPRLVCRISVRLRREGGSLSATIPRYIVRHWKLEAGMRLVVRSTKYGILLYPRYFLPYSRTQKDAEDRNGEEHVQTLSKLQSSAPSAVEKPASLKTRR